jgi:ABC-type protease/lipase transport system fused ATPase/permease subunit
VELFPGTVADNIARLGTVDSAQVVQAAQRAHVHEMILALPDGYDTMVDPAGALLSPGQRQRLALARALYGNPKLLILDEPNSNLDGAGENALAATLRDLRGKVTVVVVTHRNTLIQHVDKMLVLEGGRTQHYGPAAEVMKAMQQPKAAAQPVPERPVPVQTAAQPVRRVVNAAPVAEAAPAAAVAPVTNAAAPAADQGAKVLDLLGTIHRTGARMGRGIAPMTPPQP